MAAIKPRCLMGGIQLTSLTLRVFMRVRRKWSERSVTYGATSLRVIETGARRRRRVSRTDPDPRGCAMREIPNVFSRSCLNKHRGAIDVSAAQQLRVREPDAPARGPVCPLTL